MTFLKKIEEKWQKRWEEARIFEADPDPSKPKCFITVAYPYPNSPQHIGHARTYTMADAHARFMRMRGYNTLLPMAFHYTGTPVLAMAKRLADNDKGLVSDFTNVYKIPREKLKELTEPIAMARYFHHEIKTGMKEIGYSIDWRREFTTVDPHYNRFIEWQFKKLHQKGYISQGSHPVGWCPRDGNPVGMHDTVGDVEPEIGEFVLIKFTQDGTIFPAATLRPETVYGVTNIWINPKAEYVEAKVDGECWITSEEGAEKLAQLNRKVQVLRKFEGKEIVGKCVKNPATGKNLFILPADFVEPKNATGVVMSVPGHAPFDFVALQNLRSEPSKLEPYGMNAENLQSIEPISVIEVKGYSRLPAEDVVRKMNIREQSDPKLEEATKEVYRQEFHGGRMKPCTGKYANMPVSEAKDRVKLDLIQQGKATTMYELLNRPVFCRCKTECIVKIVQDQWFIDYGNPEWKALAHKNLDRMEILPEEVRSEFNNVIDWLHEKACARKSGMGTRLPWDKDWIIESLSDSTIYMAYYTIVKQIKQCNIQPSQLTDEVLDYVFLGIGNPEEICKKTGLYQKVLAQMRGEFTYFYPLDSRHSARELIPNHLTFMIFNHTAIFQEKLWPRQIVTNGMVLMEGAKMSKSFGNIIPLREGLGEFGADPIRLSVLSTAEILQDSDFSPTIAKAMSDRLERLYRFASKIAKTPRTEIAGISLASIDRWMLSKLNMSIKNATEAMNKLAVRKAVHFVLYELDQEFQWYLRRIATQEEKPKRKALTAHISRQVLEAQVKMLSPVAPHMSEEIWEVLGEEDFIATSPWPVYDETKVDDEAEMIEDFIMSVLEDTLSILKATGSKPRKVCYYVAAPWKWKTYTKALEESASTKIVQRDLMKQLMQDPELKNKAAKLAQFTGQIVNDINRMSEEIKTKQTQLRVINEREIIEEAKSFFEEELKAEVKVYSEEDEERDDPKKRAQLSKPYRPAIYIE